MDLIFNVNGQVIKPNKKYEIYSDMKNYLTAVFKFSDDWDGLEKTALFISADGTVYKMLLVNDECTVPWEVIDTPSFGISVYGGDLMTANLYLMTVHESGYTDAGVDPAEPTPDIYNQLVETVQAERNLALAAADLANTKAALADEKAIAANTAAGAANTAADLANTKAALADEKAIYANEQGDYALAQGGYALEQGGYAESIVNTINVNGIVKGDGAGNFSAADAGDMPITDEDEHFTAGTVEGALAEAGEHIADTDNPHGVTAAQIGLGNVDNTSDMDKPVSTAQAQALAEKADKSALTETNLRIATVEEKTIKRYGVRRAVASHSPILERVGDADGLTAAAGVGDTPATNDFDNIYPWSHMRRCNLDDNGNVTAYEGEPTYSTNGSNGQVMVEIPRFYQKHEIVDGYEYWWVCEMPLGGFRLSPAFIGSSGQVLDKIYIAAYDAGYDGTKATSVAGAHPEVRRTRTSFRTIAKARGAGWQLLDIATVCDVMQFLFIVEFATTHCQSIINGVVSLPYTDSHAAAFTELAANRIVIPNAQAAEYVVGQSIEIGTSRGGGEIAKGRVITEITPLADGINTALVFDGEAVDVTQGNLVYSAGWIAGGADGVVASSGSATSNSSGKSPFKWRGIENAWGNVFQWIDGVNILDHQAWVSSTPAEYDDTSVAAPYKKLNFKNGNENGYVKTLGEDINYPWARFPTEAGASATEYYSDNYYQNTGLRACYLGGNFYGDTNAGLFSFSCSPVASGAGVQAGARLSYKP